MSIRIGLFYSQNLVDHINCMFILFNAVLSNMDNFKQVLPFCVRVDLGVMAVKKYSTLSRSLRLEPYHQMQFAAIPKTLHFLWGEGGSYPSPVHTVSVL